MRTLVFDNSVYEDGAGWIYNKIMSWTLPGLILATLEIALINTGILRVAEADRSVDCHLCHSLDFCFPDSMVSLLWEDEAAQDGVDRPL